MAQLTDEQIAARDALLVAVDDVVREIHGPAWTPEKHRQTKRLILAVIDTQILAQQIGA